MSHPPSSLARVRAEIKTWERDFASTHGRDPSVQDIRDLPAIAEKYKLYKKLSKGQPSHLPQPTDSRLPPSNAPPVAPLAPLLGFNPFSPVKKSVKHDRPFPPSPSRLPSSFSHPNPFATPAKRKQTRPSSDPTSLSRPPADTSSSPVQSSSTAAVSRARKRLRGEPVSPSPSKHKRRRVRPQALLSLPKLEQDSSNSEHEADQELLHRNLTPSFVADSPVKPPAGGKSFKLLFDDALPVLSLVKKPAGPSRTDAQFSQLSSANHSALVSLKSCHDLTSRGVPSGSEHRVSHVQGKPSQIFPSRDHLHAQSQKAALKSDVPRETQPSISTKRALDGRDPIPLHSQCLLVPPSPPPQDPINRDTGKAKAKVAGSRKKLRVENEESNKGVDSSDDIPFKVATVSLDRRKHRLTDDLEWDLLLHLRARNHDPVAVEHVDVGHASGTFSVDLPDKLHRVLAISPSRSQNNTEERVVRGLLYGDRVGHYDPSRGGAIWDAGETDEGTLGDAETEDDWEGEPVPWEVGEL